VIIGPEIKYLLNPALLTMSRLKLKTVAFWGLGPNRHPGRSALAEWIKQHFFTSVNWWFPYTESVADYLRAKGMPPERTTVVQNATDTAQLRKFMGKIPNKEVCSAKEALTGSCDAVVGLYCGLIGGIKQLPFLLEAARMVKRICPQFHLVVIGDGPDRLWLEGAISKEPWIHYLGFKNHEGGALYYRMASVFLLAGTAGLAVVDSFAAGLPIVVTDLPTHPPEISYVVDGLNGLITEHNVEAFSKGIIEVLSDGPLRETLRKGALQAGVKYSMETMVQNYKAGIMQCLAQKNNLKQARNVAPGAGRLWI
jgi:glycosyltransferase involved in cell wall biosynthesis